jgi:hypothetical protein
MRSSNNLILTKLEVHSSNLILTRPEVQAMQPPEYDFLSQHQYGGLEQQIFSYTPPMGMPEGMCNPQLFYFLTTT